MKALGFVVARALNALYFVGSSLYCVLSYSSFAYEQFIRPQLIGWLPDAIALHHQVFWLTLVITLPTLIPALRRGTLVARASAALYVTAHVAIGFWLTVNPVLATAGPNSRTLMLAILWLVPPFGLAIVDHVTAGERRLRAIDQPRLFVGLIAAAIATWLSYVLLIPWYVTRTVGAELSPAAMALAIGISLATHLLAFALIYLVAAAALSLASATRAERGQYWALALLAAAGLALLLQRVVAEALSFRTEESWVLSAWLSVVMVAIWSGIVRHSGEPDRDDGDAIDLWFRPITANLAAATTGILCLPLIALALRSAVAQFDWNFLLQKLGVALVWALSLGWISYAARRVRAGVTAIRPRTCDAIAIAIVIAGVAAVPAVARVADYTAKATLEPEFVLDRYAALDASYQLLRSLIKTNAGADAAFYSFLKSHSTLGQLPANPVDVKLVDTMQATAPPHVFLFVIDSLRRDYLSPYNPAVTFTPAIQAFAGESVTFDRAFTRYGATGLSVPAIWTGGMLLHKQYVEPFAPMNSLEKLLDVVGYRRFMSDDHLVKGLFRASPATTLLDVEIQEMDHTVCSTVRELETKLDATASDPRPIFAMTRPLQLHVARLARNPAVPASAYPGFVPGYADQVAALDKCFGAFVEYLKRTDLYDRSVVILTSDHGESLGEEGRWGHAYTLHPEVVQIPLIVHVSKALASTMTADPTAVALSTDITPTLYAFAGGQPRDLGVLYGSSLFTTIGAAAPSRRRQPFLLASSYGPVYAMLRHNGRTLYIASAIEGRDVAYERRADGRMERLTMTDVMRSVNRGLISDHIGRIAAEYHFTPPQ